MSRFGLDYAWGRIPAPAHRAIGSSFAIRYFSHDPTKNLSAAEAHGLQAGAVDIVGIFESTANRCYAGHVGGRQDAIDGLSQAHACGMPPSRPIFFAPADFDIQPGDYPVLEDYYRGVISELGVHRTGGYHGYWPLKHLMDKGLIAFGYQTYGWSAGRWDPRACLRQFSNGHTVAGVDCDYDQAVKADFGQWGYRAAPAKRRGKGIAVSEVHVDLATLKVAIHPKPGIPAKGEKEIVWETGEPRYASQELQLGLGGKIAGEWRHHSLPFNAGPLGD